MCLRLRYWQVKGSLSNEHRLNRPKFSFKVGIDELKRRDISRHWRGTPTPTALKTCGRQFKISQATKTETPPSCVRPCCRMSWAHFIIALISSTKTQLSSLLHTWVWLSPILMRCFKKLALQHIKENIPASLDPQQYAFRANKSTEVVVLVLLRNVTFRSICPSVVAYWTWVCHVMLSAGFFEHAA